MYRRSNIRTNRWFTLKLYLYRRSLFKKKLLGIPEVVNDDLVSANNEYILRSGQTQSLIVLFYYPVDTPGPYSYTHESITLFSERIGADLLQLS